MPCKTVQLAVTWSYQLWRSHHTVTEYRPGYCLLPRQGSPMMYDESERGFIPSSSLLFCRTSVEVTQVSDASSPDTGSAENYNHPEKRVTHKPALEPLVVTIVNNAEAQGHEFPGSEELSLWETQAYGIKALFQTSEEDLSSNGTPRDLCWGKLSHTDSLWGAGNTSRGSVNFHNCRCLGCECTRGSEYTDLHMLSNTLSCLVKVSSVISAVSYDWNQPIKRSFCAVYSWRHHLALFSHYLREIDSLLTPISRGKPL